MADVFFGWEEKYLTQSSRRTQRTQSGKTTKSSLSYLREATLVSWFKDEFLDAPVQNFSDVEFAFGGAGDFVNPAELAELLAGFAEHSENFSVEGEFVDAAGETIRAVEDLV